MKRQIKFTFFAIVVLAMPLAPGAAAEDIVHDQGLVAHYEFEGNGNDNPAILNGNAKVVEDPKRGNVLSLDGSGGYLDCDQDPAFSITKEISIGCWINLEAPAEHVQTIIAKTGGEQSSWMLGIQSGKVHFYVNEARPTERTMGKVNITCGKWHHILAMYDGSETYIYVDGVLDASEKASGDIIVADAPVWIGEDSEETGLYSWSGLIDDVVVFDRTLSAEEIGKLYSKGPGPFAAGQMLQEFIETVHQAERIAEKKTPQDALVLLKQLIAKYEQWQEHNPKHPVLYYKRVLSDLYYLLAKSKEAAGAAKDEVAHAYKRALEPDKFSMLSQPRQGPSLRWLYDNLAPTAFDQVVSSLITEDTGFLRAAAAQAKIMTDRQQSTAAVSFLKSTLAALTRWREKHVFHELPVEPESTVACFQLAQAKEHAGAAHSELLDAYRNTIRHPTRKYAPQQVAALVWLFENSNKHDFAEITDSFTGNPELSCHYSTDVIRELCRYYKQKANWSKCEGFLDAFFAAAHNTNGWVKIIESLPEDDVDGWSGKFAAYFHTKPGLRFRRDSIAAQKHMTEKKYLKAAELYRHIVDRCGPEDDKTLFEFQLCKCLFEGATYQEAVAKLSDFIGDYKPTHGNLVKEAMLMKSRAHVQLGELDKARDGFFALMMEYPQAKNIAEINFFIGYCYLLQGKFEAARETFDCLTKNHPESPYTTKAKAFLKRIKSMT